MNSSSPSSLLLVGKILRPHGFKGLLRIKTYSGTSASLTERESISVKFTSGLIKEYSVVTTRPHKNIFLLKLEGIDTGDAAEQFRRAEIFVRKDTLSHEDDSYYWFELIGLKVFLDSGEYLGSLAQIIPTGSNDIYVIKEGKEETLIPATFEVIKEIDLEKKQMMITDMEGLLDLNAV